MVILRTMGGFDLQSKTGEKIEIVSKKGKALIALLVTSSNGERTRSWLQNTLWSRGSAQDSLRRELSNLRTILSPYCKNFFLEDAPRDVVRINLDVVKHDLEPNGVSNENSFLEGMDIPHENNFEEWLREIRAYYSVRSKTNRRSNKTELEVKNTLSESLSPSKRFCIGIQPFQYLNESIESEPSSYHFDDILDRIARLLISSGGVDVFDHRYSSPMPNIISSQPNMIPSAQLVLKIMKTEHGYRLNLQLLHHHDGQLICSIVMELDRVSDSQPNLEVEVREYVSESVNEILFAVSKRYKDIFGESTSVIQLVQSAVESMFDLSYSGLDLAQTHLQSATESFPESVTYAWRAYLTSQLVDDPRITNFKAVRDEAKYCAIKALEYDRYNPLTLSLLTHVYAFTLQDLSTASELMSQAKSISSDHVMIYDADSLLNMYLGDLNQSRESAFQAARLGRFLPYRYIFLTSLCMIEGLAGNHQSAANYGEHALQKHPETADRPYPPTVRYLSQSYARLGKEEKAHDLLELLKSKDVSENSLSLQRNERAAPTEEIAKFLKIGVRWSNRFVQPS